MAAARPKGVFAIGWACVASASLGRSEHVPTTALYPDHLIERITFEAGGGLGWRLSALRTPNRRQAPWKIVVITGAPSWAEYWADVIAAMPPEREMVVVDRPGYACSEPHHPVLDIATQARALAPLLRREPGQRLLLVGQSYGAAIVTLMAQANPGAIDGLVLLSGYFGSLGPTARWLVDAGSLILGLMPRDPACAVQEVRGQPPQLAAVRQALRDLTLPVHIVHGDRDDFAPLEAAAWMAAEAGDNARMTVLEGADHFVNDGPIQRVLGLIEDSLPALQPTPLRPRERVPQDPARAGGYAIAS